MTYKGFFTAIAITVSIFACQKKKQSDTVDIYNSLQPAQESEIALVQKLNDANTYIYRSQTGTIYRAYYLTDQPDKKVIIKTPEHIIVLPQKEAWAKGALYEKNTAVWEAQEDQITLKIGDNKEILHQISPIVKNYANETEQIKITSTFEDNKNYVLLERKDQPDTKLVQCDEKLARVKYCNDSVIWEEQKDQAILTVNGSTTNFELKK